MTVQSLTRRRPRAPRCQLSGLSWVLILVTGLVTVLVSAAENRIELRDGSVISGELIGIEGGVYRVRSRALGEVTVRESEVLAIRPATAETPAPAPSANTGGPQSSDLMAIQRQLLANPGIMESITRLQSDPAIQTALADPEFTRLILSGNLEALRANPRFQGLMENPAIRAIVGQALGH